MTSSKKTSTTTGFSQKEREETMKKEIKYKDITQFIHCKDCMDKFLDSDEHKTKSPKEFGKLEAGSIPFTYPDGTKANIIAIFCGHCEKQVWDTRHLQPLF